MSNGSKLKKIRVLVADDHPAFREGLCRLLEDVEDLEIVAKAADGEEAIRLAEEQLPDVVIIDISMPVLSGIDAAKQIKMSSPSTAIIMVSAFDYQSYVLAALRVKASGYLLKNVPIDELVNAIRLVHAGEGVFNLKAVSNVLRRVAINIVEGGGNPQGLQPRELQVLKLVSKGLTNKDIALDLFISERTVQTHLINIFRKLKVSSRTEAVLAALRDGWLSLDNLPARDET